MRLLSFIIVCFVCHSICLAQTIEDPVFDRSDIPAFRIKEVRITTDTTYVVCSYQAEENSWANISNETFLEDINDGTRYRIINVSGIPFSPGKKYFIDPENIQVTLFFPHIPTSTNRMNIIENDDNYAFNVYGIDLKKKYANKYSYNDIVAFHKSLNSMAESKDWLSAISYTMRQLEASQYVFGVKSPECSMAMCNLSREYYELNDFDKAIEWGKKAINILNVSLKDSLNLEVLATAYECVGNSFKMKGQEPTASQYIDLSLSIRKQIKSNVSLNYVEFLQAMALEYYHNEEYPQALLYGQEVANIYETKYNENSKKYGCDYINSLVNLCEFYQRVNQFEEAIKIGKLALEKIDYSKCEEKPWLRYYIYNNVATALVTIGKIDEGISYLETIINESPNIQSERLILSSRMVLANILLDCNQDTIRAIYDYKSILKTITEDIKMGKTRNNEYIAVLNKLYNVCKMKDRDMALFYLDKIIQFQKEWNGDESIAYANSLLEFVTYSFTESMLSDQDIDSTLSSIDSLYNDLRKSLDIIKRHLNNSKYYMSRTERTVYWKRYESVFTWLIPTMCGMMNSPKWNCLAYDASLFHKGMLLSSELDFKNVIQFSNDTTLNEVYISYVYDLELLEKQLSLDHFTINVDSLKEQIKCAEHFLSKEVSGFDRYNNGTNIAWEEVKNQLSDGDIAVEIVSYESLDGVTTNYEAYAISNKSEYPRHVFLFTDKELKELMNLDCLDYWENFADIIWINDSLNSLVKNVNKIYFSPSGLLNAIGIEYIPFANDLNRDEKCEMIRLSSTRELCMTKDRIAIENACIYGGLDYNNVATNPENESDESYGLSRSAIESLLSRGGFDNLPGSIKEAEQVELELTGKSINCKLYNGIYGTESSFKELSGTPINLLHLSTHGMYIHNEKDSLIEGNNFRFVISDKTPYIDDEDKNLSHSFLVMSGGNALIHRDSISVNTEDGILTALEISHLDFSNLDLVVLSACETALGVIDYEGVYGLQRGFKKAGAKTILMSTDKVDDEATRILMVEFYRNLMNGKTKRRSLQEAQQYLREIDNGKYDEPKYWASFILLDGLD